MKPKKAKIVRFVSIGDDEIAKKDLKIEDI